MHVEQPNPASLNIHMLICFQKPNSSIAQDSLSLSQNGIELQQPRNVTKPCKKRPPLHCPSHTWDGSHSEADHSASHPPG